MDEYIIVGMGALAVCTIVPCMCVMVFFSLCKGTGKHKVTIQHGYDKGESVYVIYGRSYLSSTGEYRRRETRPKVDSIQKSTKHKDIPTKKHNKIEGGIEHNNKHNKHNMEGRT